MSRLTQARGLKHIGVTPDNLERVVAPHTGAWIETKKTLNFMSNWQSRLTQARGLKR